MKNWTKAVVLADSTVRDAMRQIDATSLQIALVVDQSGRLAGTVTDGDVRRGILRGIGLDDPIGEVMNRHPMTVPQGSDASALVTRMRALKLRHMPVVNERGELVGLETLEDLTTAPERRNPVVIMAGGLGTRLLPLTANCPKPMLPIGDRPILEHTLTALAEQGFREFHFAINYLGDMVEDHFGDGSRWGVTINYLRERQRMGTAGALSLLPSRPETPFLIMNGDVLTKLNFNQLLDMHEANGATTTMCVRQYEYQVPFGVAQISEDRLVMIEEKPIMRHFVSAGIYVVQPNVLDHIPVDCFFDMPQLLNKLLGHHEAVHVYPITEYWLDVGRHDDMQRAIADYWVNLQ